MMKFLVTAAAVAALGSTAPASAQVGGILQQGIQGLLGGGGIGDRFARLDNQIRIAFERRDITQRQASRLQNELLQIRQLEQSYRMDGLSRDERRELQYRLEQLERRLERARYQRDGRDDDDDRWDDDDRYDRKGCPPGLAKKNNGCLPPGKAKKHGYSNGRYGSDYDDRYQDRDYRNDDRYTYRRDGDRILQIDRRTGRVVRVIDARR